MEKLIVIPARYESTRLPGKPLLEIAGKPLIRLVYERAGESRLKDRIIVATDDERIAEAVSSFGAEAVMTSPSCRSGTDRVFEAIKEMEADIIINLQGDEPFIRPDMADLLFSVMEKEDLDMATLCCPIANDKEYHDPNTVKVVLDRHGFALYFSRSPIPYLRNSSNRPLLYKHIGIYAFKRDFLERFVAMPKSRLEEMESLEQLRVLENGFRIRVLTTHYDGFGIDTLADLERARLVLDRKIM
ncbi:MAG: 3-deoxy-manno-octulosonate cytidylyltransferase [Syntrophorhabdaceae bacterium]|nr:3-deoxy-manno-octulosonate cytidylyltransferase [Syntrophorhabdaceae bacterium]HBL25105.1 3-deoxy-manno-octulosonate cytidylyltransferase [Deltaproteobacteria bacterium]